MEKKIHFYALDEKTAVKRLLQADIVVKKRSEIRTIDITTIYIQKNNYAETQIAKGKIKCYKL